MIHLQFLQLFLLLRSIHRVAWWAALLDTIFIALIYVQLPESKPAADHYGNYYTHHHIGIAAVLLGTAYLLPKKLA
jgi:hypothetical protein